MSQTFKESDLPSSVNLIHTDLHIPLKQLHLPDRMQITCIALLNCNWISYMLRMQEYYSPPNINMNEDEISCFLMPSIQNNFPEGWNSFTISVLDKLPLNSPSHPQGHATTESIFHQLIQLKTNLKLRDREILASSYYTSEFDHSFHLNTIDNKLLETYFGCIIIKVPDNIPKYEFTSDFKHSFLDEPSSPHLIFTYFILETSRHFYIIQPHYKVSLLDAVKYSPTLLNSNRILGLFLLYQLKASVESLSESLTSPHTFNLASLYIDQNLWLYHMGISPTKIEGIYSHNNRVKVNSESEATLLHESTKLWQECKLSNFDYLMVVNKFAGRKEGDPNNHPFLPWVSDFKTPDKSWRDLTKSKYRLSKGDAQLDFTYSSPASSSKDGMESFLEPHHVTDTFSEITYFIYLARRTPRSILCKYVRPRWEPSEYPTSVARIQEWTPDESIPEFFTQPSIFHSIHTDLPDLKIPDWCDSPESFITWHRNALESDHVSLMLHHWIDLYFGYKLSGDAGLKAKNIPHFLIKQHELPYNYGINQLFRDPHPRKQLSNPLQIYYKGAELSFSSQIDVYSSESQRENNRYSLFSIEIVNLDTDSDIVNDNNSSLSEPDANDECRDNIYDSCQVDFDPVHVSHTDIAEPLIRRPEETKRTFDFEGTKNITKHFGSIFRGRTDVLDESHILKYRSYIPLAPNPAFGRLLDEFDLENSFFFSHSISSCSPLKRVGEYLLYQGTTNSLHKQILLLTLSLEFLSSDLLKLYPYSALLGERLNIIIKILKDTQIQTKLDAKPLLTMLKRYLSQHYLCNNFTTNFPIKFPSYFESIHSFLSKINAHKCRLMALSHLRVRQYYRACDYSTLISLLHSDSAALLTRVPQEGLHLIGNHLKWIFTDALLSPLAFLEVFNIIATYLPSLYLQQNYLVPIQKVYCDLKDHPIYPFLFQRSFISSLINIFGPMLYFTALFKYLLKALISDYCSSPVAISLISDNLTILQRHNTKSINQNIQRPVITIKESDSGITDLLNDIASSLIASDTFVWLFNFFGITFSTKFLVKELLSLLPDYSCKFILEINSFEDFHEVFLRDTCFITIHTIFKHANNDYVTFICFNSITSWITQVQKRVLNVRTEALLLAILVISNIWILTVSNHNIQLTLSRFLKDIVDVTFQFISSTSSLFTRGADFRYRLLIALLHILSEIVSNEIEPHNLALVKSVFSKTIDTFMSLINLRELQNRQLDPSYTSKPYTQLLTIFDMSLLSHFIDTVENFLKEHEISIPSTAHPNRGKVQRPRLTFSHRYEFKELASLFYPLNSGLSTKDINYGRSTWFLPSSDVQSSFSLVENEKNFETKFSFSTPPSNHPSPHTFYNKFSFVDYLKQTHGQTEDPKIFTCLKVLTGSEIPITKLSYTPCENVIFGSSRENVTIWRLHDSLMQSENHFSSIYKNHTRPVKSLCYACCSNNVVSNDGCIHVWNIETLYNSYKHQHHNKLHQIHCTSPQTERIIYSATSDSTITMLDTRVARLAFDWIIPSTPSTFQHISVTPDDTTIYISSSNGAISMVDTRMGHILGNWFVADAEIISMLLHKNQLFIASSDSLVKIFSLQGQLYQTIGCRSQFEYMEGLTDSAVVCNSFYENTLTLYIKQDTWMPTHKWALPNRYNNSSISSMVYVPLQQYLIISTDNGLVFVYGTHFTHIVPNFK